MKINILLKRARITSVWRDQQGEVQALGHDIEPRSMLPALNRAAGAMRRVLHERGDDVRDVDTELKGLAGLKPNVPEDWKQAFKVLRAVVYGMGERLCEPGMDVVDVEIGDAPPAGTLN